MGKLEKLSITMPDEMVKAIHEMVDSGGYASVSEVMRAGMRSLLERQKYAGWSLEELRHAWTEGEMSGEPIDGPSAMQRLQDGLAETDN